MKCSPTEIRCIEKRARDMERRYAQEYQYSPYDEITEPQPIRGINVTAPLPISALPRESWFTRAMRGIGKFFAAIVKKINQLLALGLAVLLLLLFTRFVLDFFNLKLSLFAQWVFQLTSSLVLPFNNLLPALPYQGYTIDVSTLIAIIVYILAVTIVRQFLKLLVTRPF